MVEISRYMDDGAGWQEQAVLAYVRKFADSVKDIEQSIDMVVESKADDPLIGLGVLLEVMWKNSDNDFKNTILENIKKGLN